MKQCEFIPKDGKYVCKNCGTIVPVLVNAVCMDEDYQNYINLKHIYLNSIEDNPFEYLGKQTEQIVQDEPVNDIQVTPIQEPSFAKKVINFTKAFVNHIKTGFRQTSEEEIEERLVICKSCPLFKFIDENSAGVCTHETCGCNISDAQKFFNKLAWADQSCPLGKWKQIEVKQ